jgi:hypothetical protein
VEAKSPVHVLEDSRHANVDDLWDGLSQSQTHHELEVHEVDGAVCFVKQNVAQMAVTDTENVAHYCPERVAFQTPFLMLVEGIWIDSGQVEHNSSTLYVVHLDLALSIQVTLFSLRFLLFVHG